MKQLGAFILALFILFPSAALGETVQEYSKSKAKNRIEETMGENFDSAAFKLKEAEVKPVLSMLPGVLDGGGSAPRRHGYRGVPKAEVDQRYEDDLKEITDDHNWDQCQDESHKHTVDDLSSWPGFTVEIKGNEIHLYWYYRGSGDILGQCLWYIGSAYGYDIFFKYDIIQYFYPVAKINVSEQPFMSYYLDKDQVKTDRDEVVKANGDADEVADKTENELEYFFDQTKKDLGAHGVTLNLDPKANPDYSANLQEAINNTKADVKKLSDEARTSNPGDYYMEARYLHEWEDQVLAHTLFIPHALKTSDAATDVFGGWVYSRLMTESQWDSNRWGFFIEPLGSTKCISHNIAKGKTPEDIFPHVVSKEEHFDLPIMLPIFPFPDFQIGEEICLDKVGEVFPYTYNARVNPIDKAFQAAQKIVNLTDATLGTAREYTFAAIGSEFHTYWRAFDKWYVIRDEGIPGLKAHAKQCTPIPEMSQENIAWPAYLNRKPQEGSEVTFELWGLFKGCYGMSVFTAPFSPIGYKGLDDDFWMIGKNRLEEPGTGTTSKKIPRGLRVH
ncbi:MAG: hypothetical protein J5J00_12380 [Deltaproteobacteria bacterium]|nr:hypothetical protein [Deltaproteobacteria bacterium]